MDGQCAKCGLTNKERICRNPDGKHPDYCCTTLYPEALKTAASKYMEDGTQAFALAASRQEAACYAPYKDPSSPLRMPVKPRILEIIEFCHRMNYKRIGLAFCGGLHKEASMLIGILENGGLEVVSAMCKVGGVEKEYLGLKDEEKIRPGTFEPMCNPIGQAMILNAAKTQFNLVMGLCVGHDSLFLKNSEALCTVVAVKDRLMGHNPLAALYTSHSYYNYLKG